MVWPGLVNSVIIHRQGRRMMSHNELSHQGGMGWAVVNEFQVGRSFEAYVQFVRREQRKTAKGDPFYICVFGDKTGKVESRL